MEKRKTENTKIFSLILACLCVLIFAVGGRTVQAADGDRVSIAFDDPSVTYSGGTGIIMRIVRCIPTRWEAR